LKNIKRVEAYRNISLALDNNGIVYAWGEGYANLAMKVVFSEKVTDISGRLLLTEKGRIYDISDLNNYIRDFKDIAKISCGEENFAAISTDGSLYLWGDNTYGQCANKDVNNTNAQTADFKVIDISAGNGTTIIQSEDKKVYVIGKNSEGQIGLGDKTSTYEMTEINVGTEIESISCGEGTHSGLIDKDGFVWHTGTNINGELGIANNENKIEFEKNGQRIIRTNFEKKFLDKNEVVTVVATLENTFNLKIDLIDDNQDNFYLDTNGSTKVSVNKMDITALDYGSTNVKVIHSQTNIEKQVQIIVAMKMESIVQGFRDADFTDGEYSVVVNDQPYNVELINIYGDTRYSLDEGETEKIVSLGDDSAEHKTLVVKYHGDLTVDKGVTLTANTVDGLTYKKGMYICALGNIYNNGNISMTGRGTYNQEGENVYLWRNIDNTYEYVPAAGGVGGEALVSTRNQYKPGLKGEDGKDRATGGGGSGTSNASDERPTTISGAGARGTSYSGGSGGGGIDANFVGGSIKAQDAEQNGGKGGDAASYRGKTRWITRYAGGGAGNTGGTGKYTYSGQNTGTDWSDGNAENGTGGLLMIYTNDLYNNGEITANGMNGGSGRAPGGSSGGGSINIFANLIKERGSVTANGGTVGGLGGNGSVTINELGSRLNYEDKVVQIPLNTVYKIDQNKISYTKLNDIQTEDLTLGTITYEVKDNSVAGVDTLGNITGKSLGKTKVKITDETNGYSTYIIIEVINTITRAQIKLGEDYTVTLKENGTVWTFGKNNKGQLGNGTKNNSNKPVVVLEETTKAELENIIDIDASGEQVIAVSKTGEVYTWGALTKHYTETKEDPTTHEITEIDKSEEEIKLYASKVDGLSDIIRVSTYNGNFFAVNKNGEVFVWGKDYKDITKLNVKEPVVEMSGDLLLGKDGLVYKLDNLNEHIKHLSNVVRISYGNDHNVFLTDEGRVYTIGKNDKGQLGNGKNADSEYPTLVRTENGFLEDVYKISAGNKTSLAATFDGKLYTWGDNENKKIGLSLSAYNLATEVLEGLNEKETVIDIKDIEIVAGGKNHSAIADVNGFVYTVGLNSSGQLGTEDNTNRPLFREVGHKEIKVNPENIILPINTSKDISIALGNTFNLKTDIVRNTKLTLNNTNEKEAVIEEIAGVNNDTVININNFNPNYRITGNKIGRVNITAKSEEGYFKNVWVNVVDSESAKVAAKVTNGEGFTVTLRNDGTVWTFGNTNGKNNPEKIEVPEEIIDISSGKSHTLLLGKSGKVYSFGLNSNGQLGTGNLSTYKVPVKLNIEGIEKIIAKENTSYAITKTGEVYAWGEGYTKSPVLKTIEKEVKITNEEGQEVTNKIALNIVDISKNYYLADDGIVRKILDNEEIKLSLNEYDPSEAPVLVEERIVQISEGTDHLLLLGKSGKVYSYGKNVYGQLGDNTTVGRENGITTVVRIEDGTPLINIQEISAGNQYGIAVSKDGKVYTWGINRNKELGFESQIELRRNTRKSYSNSKRRYNKCRKSNSWI